MLTVSPIPFHLRNRQTPPPECDMTLEEFRNYARQERWRDKTIDLMCKGWLPKDRFMCGGRLVLVKG